MIENSITHNSTTCQAFAKYFGSEKMSVMLGIETFSGTNEKAADILSVCGFDGFISGSVFAPKSEVVRFFEVSKDYISGALPRYRFIPQEMPYDVIRLPIAEFLRQQGIKSRYEIRVSKDDTAYQLFDKIGKTPTTIQGTPGKRIKFLSARAILSLTCFLYYGRRIPENSRIREVFEKLKHTSYYDGALRRVEENRRTRKQLENQKRAAEESSSIKGSAGTKTPGNGVLLSPDGVISMTAEVFSKIIADGISTGINHGMREVNSTLSELVRLVQQVGD